MYSLSQNQEKYLHRVLLPNSQSQQNKLARYLEAYIVMDECLTWKEHISDICTKAIKAKAFLRCNLYNCPASLKNPIAIHENTSFSEANTKIYCKSMVPTLTISEKVQRSTTGFVNSYYSRFS